jgi:hypothetical protein
VPCSSRPEYKLDQTDSADGVTGQIFRAIVALVATIILSIGSSESLGQARNTQSQMAEEAFSVKAMTELIARTSDQIARAKYFDNYGHDQLRPGEEVTRMPGLPLPPPPPPPAGIKLPPPPTREDLLKGIVCGAGLVVAGTVADRRPFLNSKQTFLFTDHRFTVTQRFRGDAPREIVVSIAGGHAVVDHRKLSATGDTLMRVAGTYLLFLNKIPGAHAYRIFRRPVELADGKASLSPAVFPSEIATVEVDRLFTDIVSIAPTCGAGS